MRKRSVVAPDWWDYTTISDELVSTRPLTVEDMAQLSVWFQEQCDTIEEFYLAEALERGRSTPSKPVASTKQPAGGTLSSVGLNLGKLPVRFLVMNTKDGVAVLFSHSQIELCFNKIRPDSAFKRKTCIIRQAIWRLGKSTSSRPHARQAGRRKH